MSVTVLRCKNPHPVRGVSYRPHGATLGSAAGEWFPTGRILQVRAGELPTINLEPDHQLGYCARCKAATEYRRAAA